jgi:hypothetical protein
MFADQVGKIGGVDAALDAIAEHRQIEHFNETPSVSSMAPAPLSPGSMAMMIIRTPPAPAARICY